jgi:ribA/ribD-fused uncharacterized protein
VSVQGFSGEHFWLSNFYVGGEPVFDCASVEHFYQSMKTTNLFHRRVIAKAASPGASKRLGRRVLVRPDWELIKVDVMRMALAEKFAPGNSLAGELLRTVGYLEETNDWGDIFWGVCRGSGTNMLGILLMERRELLRGLK